MPDFRRRRMVKMNATLTQIRKAIVPISPTKLRVIMLVIVLGLVSSASLILAQGTSGSLTGQVTDSTGAAISSATVTLTNLDTNYPQTIKTDSSGSYQFKLVSPGNYSLTIMAQGFAEYVQK